MSFSIIAGGLYHYKYYLDYLVDDPEFQCFYFSHKLSTLLHLPKTKRVNLPFKEYLMYAHIRILGTKSAFSWMSIYSFIWDMTLSMRFSPADVNLFLLQGNNSFSMKKAKLKHKVVVGEAVNVHPRRMLSIMNKDANEHGVKFFWSESVLNQKLREISYVDYLITPSITVAESYIEEGFPKEKIITIPYGAVKDGGSFLSNNKKKDELHYKKKKINLLCVAQVFPRKGQYHLLKALSAYEGDYEFNLTLVGIADINYLEAMKKLDFAFTYHEKMAHDKVIEIMASSDVVVLNSLEDGFGMVVSEAMSVGTPVVVSKYAGASEMVNKIGGGMVSDPLDYVGTIDAIISCFNDNYPEINSELPTWKDYAFTLSDVLSQLSKT